ncbi:MAG: hypothetical protein KAS16_08795 [Thermoplasmata archaeon]|nr:hypothetical protein [Thermoplasmata archaeon]
METKVNFPVIIWQRTLNLLFSVRGLIALLMSVYMVVAGAYLIDMLMESSTIYGELINLFNDRPDLRFQWFFFDGALTKLVTLFTAPLFVFDAVCGDKKAERIGILLSRPISRVQYMFINLGSAILAFSILFFGALGPGYFAIQPQVPELTAGAYFGTAGLLWLLGVFTLCVALLISTMVKSNLLSFIISFGLFSFYMLPNTMKYNSDAMLAAAKITPHYYATYFTTNDVTAGLYIGHALVIIIMCLPFLALAIWKFKSEDL